MNFEGYIFGDILKVFIYAFVQLVSIQVLSARKTFEVPGGSPPTAHTFI